MKKILFFLLVLLVTYPAARFLYKPGYFNMHDDLQVMRVYEMGRCFNDGQIPCRWAPDMVWSYGQAMFNYYSAFPYYIGQLIREITPFSIMATVKILFLISIVVSFIGMYLLAKEFFGKWGGFLSAFLYVYAPYHVGVDVFVRGAMAESFALSLLPFLWLGFYKLIKEPKFKNIALTSLVLGAFLTTHNVSTIMYAPFTILWVLFWIIRTKNWKVIRDVALAGVLGVGIASFFFLPVIFEQNLIQTQFLTSDYLNYEAHFVTLNQLFFKRIWGYGPSIFGPNDDLSFAIGWPNWWLIIPAFAVGFLYLRKKEKRENGLLVLLVIVLGFASTFLTHMKSLPIWHSIQVMSFIQFPWRFLGLTVFSWSLAAGILVTKPKLISKLLTILIIIVELVLNYSYFVPFNYSSKETDAIKLSGIQWQLQQKSATLDYLPKTAPQAPEQLAPSEPKVVKGQAFNSNYQFRSNAFSFDSEVYKEATMEVPIMDFPNWTVISDGKVVKSWSSGTYGSITITLPEGKHIIQGRFESTKIRIIGNTLTVISLSLLLLGYIILKNKKKLLWIKE